MLWRFELGYASDEPFVEDLEAILEDLANFYLDVKENARRFGPSDTWLRPMLGTLLALGAVALVGLRSRKAYLRVLTHSFRGFVDHDLAAEMIQAFKKCFGILPGLEPGTRLARRGQRLRRVRNTAWVRGTDDPLIPGFMEHLESQRQQAEPAYILNSRVFALPLPGSTEETARHLAEPGTR